MSDEEDSGAGQHPPSIQPKTVLYCGVCGLPPEYCEFGPEFDKCKPWILKHCPQVYPELSAGSGEAPSVDGLSLADSASKAGGVGASKEGGAAPKEEKAAKGGKKKKQEKLEVLVEKVTRSKRKSVTSIKGLELFGVKLPDAAKKMGKKFACGASVTKGPTEKEQIDVQGDIILDIADYITETWPEVPQGAIFLIEDGKKMPAY